MTVSESAQLELQRMVEARLGRFGAVGKVLVQAGVITLEGGGPSASLPVQGLLERWDRLSFGDRERECALLAGALQRQRRPAPPAARQRRSLPLGWLMLSGLVLAAGASYRRLKAQPPDPVAGASPAPRAPLAAAALDGDAERRRHAATVCEATRARVARGGLVGATDVEGWVVELGLIQATSGPGWPSLDPFISNSPPPGAGGRIVWKGAPELARLDGSETRVEVEDLLWPEEAPQFRERRLRFSGAYVPTYFREREQIQLVRFAHALAEQHGASLAGLYAHCADDAEHHLGSWFLGASPGAAAASLLFFMGAQAVPAQLSHDVLSSRADREFEPAFALSNLLAGTERLKKPQLVELLGAQSGTVAGSGTVTTLAFPFVESDRALFASRSLAHLFEPPQTPAVPRRAGAR